MSERFAHVCQDGHELIGHNDSEHELCPLCRMNQEGGLQAQIAALVSAVTARNAQLAAISEQIRAGFEGLNKEVQFIRGYTEAANENVAGLAERLSAIESNINARVENYATNSNELAIVVSGRLAAIERKLAPLSPIKEVPLKELKKVYRCGAETKQGQSNQRVDGKQRRRKKR